MFRRRAVVCAIAAAVAGSLMWSCGFPGELAPVLTPTPSGANLIQNGGFESGDAPWQLVPQSPAARISDASAHTGSHSIEAEFSQSTAFSLGVGATQAVGAQAIPEFVSGFYRNDRWEPDGATLYLEFTVTVRGGGFADGALEHTLHFSIAGAQRQPAGASEGAFVFLDRSPPKTGAWTYFGYPVAYAFEARFGKAPDPIEGASIGFDIASEGATAKTRAVVYFDDLYAGAQVVNPNRPVDD